MKAIEKLLLMISKKITKRKIPKRKELKVKSKATRRAGGGEGGVANKLGQAKRQ